MKKYLILLISFLTITSYSQNFTWSLKGNIYQITTNVAERNYIKYDYFTIKNIKTDEYVASRIFSAVSIMNLEIVENYKYVDISEENTKILYVNDSLFILIFKMKDGYKIPNYCRYENDEKVMVLIKYKNNKMYSIFNVFFKSEYPSTITKIDDKHYVINTEEKIDLYLNQCWHKIYTTYAIESECIRRRYSAIGTKIGVPEPEDCCPECLD